MSLTFNQLFTPDESGVGVNPNAPPAPGTWLDTLLQIATIVGLPATSWQPGAPERTILAITAVALAQADALVSLQAQGGFLDFAASGTVTYTALNGVEVTQAVTPDPSNPAQNPSASLGWLDAIGQSYFATFRLQATFARGPLAIANTTPGTLSYISGNYHVANAVSQKTYANAIDINIPTSTISGGGGVVTGVVSGAPTTFTTGAPHGLAPNDVVYIISLNGISGLSNNPFAVVSNVTSATTFTISRTTSGTWTSGGTIYKCTVVDMIADEAGTTSDAGPGQATITVTQNVGVLVSNAIGWSASNWETNQKYAQRCRLHLAALSPNGPADAYNYFALSAFQILSEQTPPIVMTNGPIDIVTTFSNPAFGIVTPIVSSTTPASIVLGQAVTPGCAQLPIIGATNASPIVITTSAPHGLLDGYAATISGVLGNTAANITSTVTFISTTQFSLDGTTGNGSYTGGGQVEGGDLGQVDNLIQKNVVPDGIIAVTTSALAFPVLLSATVIVPQAYIAIYPPAAVIALQNLFKTFPIGGNVPPGGSAGTITTDEIVGALVGAGVLTFGAVSYVRDVNNLLLNGAAIDLVYPTNLHVAILQTPAINVVGV